MQAFTSNFKDLSSDAGFQFVFMCDICKEGYKTNFIESKTYKKKGFLKKAAGLTSAAAMIGSRGMGGYRTSYGVRRGADALAGGATQKSPKWHKEHEAAFEVAQNEGKEHFHRCPKCYKYVCENDWNEQEGLCVVDAPRINIEVAAAKAKKAVEDIQSKAEKTQVFTGEIESKQTLCPQCDKPAGEGKFCINCGMNLQLAQCDKCGAQNQGGTKFCGECGNKLI